MRVIASRAALLFILIAHAGSARGSEPRPLSLEDCLQLARQHNPTLSQARERIQELRADQQAARSRFFPRIALTAYYQRLDPDRLPPGGMLPAGQQLFGGEALASVSARQILFAGGKTYYGARATRFSTEAQRLEVSRGADEVTYAVTEAYYRLLEGKENLKVAREARDQRKAFARLTEVFFRAGKVTRLDALRARSRVSEAEQTEREAENAVALARVILATTIGLGQGAVPEVRGELPRDPPAGPDRGALWREALRANPELRRIELELARSQALVKAARGAYFPELSLQAALGVRYQDVAGAGKEWQAGAFLELPLFEGGVTRAQVAKAASQEQQSLEKKRARLDGLRAELASAWRDQENARLGVVTARQTIATNAEAEASAQALYRTGKAIALDVLQAQTDLTLSRFGLVRYQVSHALAQARIRQLLGASESPRRSETR